MNFLLLQVVSIFHTYYEVKLCKPRLKKLRYLLEKCSYKGSELENEVLASNELYTWEMLSAKIQASDSELKNGLKEIGAFELDGITVLNTPYTFTCIAIAILTSK